MKAAVQSVHLGANACVGVVALCHLLEYIVTRTKCHKKIKKGDVNSVDYLHFDLLTSYFGLYIWTS